MNYVARPIEGSIIDLPIEPWLAVKYVTNEPGGHGMPINIQPSSQPVPEKPKDLGEERHLQLLSALKGIKVSQTSDQRANVTEALVQNRDWRR